MKTFFTILIIYTTIIFSQTKTWLQSTDSEFSQGKSNNVVVTNINGGELQLIAPLVRQENDTLNSSIPQYVSYDDAGNYITGWITNGRIYVQKFDADNQAITTPIMVDDSGDVFLSNPVSIALLNSGKFVVGWHSVSPSLRFEMQYIQFFDNNNSKIGKNIIVFGIDGTGSTPFPVADNINDRYIIISTERKSPLGIYPGIYKLTASIYSGEGNKIHDSISVVPSGGTTTEVNVSGAIHNGKLALAWEGNNSVYGPGDIYTAFYDTNCVPLTAPLKLVSQRTSPSLDFDEEGDCCITWLQQSGSIPGPPSVIFAQVLSPTGDKIGGITKVSDLKEGSIFWHKIKYLNGMFRLAWFSTLSNGQPDFHWVSYWKLEQITDGNYISQIFDAGSSQTLFIKLSWNEIRLSNTSIKFQLRSSNTKEGIESSAWSGPSSSSDFYISSSGEPINPVISYNRYLQVKILLHSSIVGTTPVLNDFSVSYISSDTISPLPPSNFIAKSDHRRIILEWTKSGSSDVKSYRLYKAVDSDNPDTASYTEITGDNNIFIDSSVVCSAKYKYGITAVDSTNNESEMLLSSVVSPKTMMIFVSASGSAHADGSPLKPFSKINNAITFSGKGDTVFVLPGEYNENIVLKNGISLIGSNAASTKIISSLTSFALITGKNNVVKGFTFLTGGGISCTGRNVTISENMLIHQGGNFDVGIFTDTSNNVLISKNILMNFSIGIQSVAIQNQPGIRTTIRNNIIQCVSGILNNYNNLSIINNTFIAEGSSGICVSINGGNVTLMNNCFAGYPSQNGYIRSVNISMEAAASLNYNDIWNCNGDLPDTISSTNIFVDPQFKSVSKNDFHLNESSGCINKGNPDKKYKDMDGSRNDIGAYGGPDPLPDYLNVSLVTDLSLNNVSGFPGDTITVDVKVSNATGLKNAKFNIQFDNSMMTFLKAATAQLTGEFELKVVQSFVNTLTINLNGSDEINSGSGCIVTLKFLLIPSLNIDKRCAVEIGTADLFDGEGNRIYVSSIINGSCVVRVKTDYPTRIFVNGNYSGTEDGTIVHPYTSIQKGIDNADAGDTVIVAAGKYSGPVIMRSKVFVMGLGANVTNLECPDDPLNGTQPAVIFNKVDSSGIAGLSLINYSTGNVIEVISSTAIISMNKIDQSGMGYGSIVTDSASSVIIRDNYFSDSKNSGMVMLDIFAHEALITRNIFSSSGSVTLISVRNNKNTIITNNRFYLNGSTGIEGYQVKEMTICNNLFLGDSDGGFGIHLLESDSTLIANNVFDLCKTGLNETNGTQQIYNNIFDKNDIALSIESSTKHQYNILWNNGLDFGKGQKDNTEISSDPLFVNQAESNYKLLALSPALNAGNPAAEWNDADETRNDIGLYGGPFADQTMYASLNSRLCIVNVPGSPGDTVLVPIYAMGIAGISGIKVLLTYDNTMLKLLETHTTENTRDFVLLRNQIGSSIVELTLQGYHSIVLDSGAVIEIKFSINQNASDNIPLTFQNVQLYGANTQVIDGISFVNGQIMLNPNSVGPGGTNIPKDFVLYQNYPNPFNPVTKIKYSIPNTSYITLKVYNILGQEVRTLFEGLKRPGNYIVNFNAGELASGVYFYRLQSDNFVQTKKLLLLK